ncbi:hypothetical protein HOLleu_33995 [Holothuria leucospilota]|uniref:Uncharacterized protein n=1 Tax=Holothuria leucospilota TaxID=206669 RepID=A0A9Q1BI23_HOLLE|nr:hypothetical protein HOLleu_33995 [Holothuria leucospilota]
MHQVINFQVQDDSDCPSCGNKTVVPVVVCLLNYRILSNKRPVGVAFLIPCRRQARDLCNGDVVCVCVWTRHVERKNPIVFGEGQRSFEVTGVLTMSVSTDATDPRVQSYRSWVLEQLKRQIQARSSVDIFIFFRELYGHLVQILFCSVKFLVKVNSLTHLNNLRDDLHSGYITEELTELLLEEDMRTKMDQHGLHLSIQLDHESFKAVHNFFVSEIGGKKLYIIGTYMTYLSNAFTVICCME